MGPTIKELREVCKKKYWHFLQEYDHKYIGVYITWVLVRLRITPAQVTVFWILLQIFSTFLFLKGEYAYFVAGISIYLFCSVLDSVDGQLARYYKKFSVKWIYLDQVGHHIINPLFFIFLSIGVYRQQGNFLYLGVGILAFLFYIYGKLLSADVPPECSEKLKETKRNLSAKRTEGLKTLIIGFIRLEHIFNIMFWFIVFNKPHYGLIFYTVLFFIDMVRRVSLITLKLSKVDHASRNTSSRKGN